MNTAQEHLITEPFLRSVTPRRPLRGIMNALQTEEECNNVTEDEMKKSSCASVWESTASWSRHHLHIPPTVKIAYYITTLLLLSSVQHYVDLPHIDGLTGKQSVLNQMFVKKGWGFTLAVFLPYQFISIFLRTKMLDSLKKLIIRSAATTFFFFIWCQVLFPAVDHFSSTCISGNETLVLRKRECLSIEGQYLSFDISGHSYLLTYCVLIMMEESKDILYYLWLGRRLFGDGARERRELEPYPSLSEKQVKSLRRRYHKLSPFVVVTFLSMCALALLWDFMLVVTTLYYHTFAEKVLGTGLAFLMWGLLYHAFFPWLFKLKVFGS